MNALLHALLAATVLAAYSPTKEIEQFHALPRYDGASNEFAVPSSITVASLTGPKSYILGAVGPGIVLIAFGIISL